MSHASSPIILTTLLLEKNRWNGKGPSLNVEEWLEPMAETGFHGFELWMHHLALASRSDWEAIKNEAAAQQVELSMIYAQLPADTGEKGRRQREALLDACDFFRPKALRFHLGEPITQDGYISKLSSRLETAKVFIQDIPRDIALVFEPQLYPFQMDEAEKVLGTLGSDRVSLCLRVMEMPKKDLEAAFALGKNAITHFSIRAKKGKDFVALSQQRDLCKQILQQARQAGFIGPWLLETTQGVGAKGEDAADLFDAAERDFAFLQEFFGN